MPARTLNATAASLLGFLHDGPLTGWDLVAVAQDRIGDFWSLTQSQVYRELAAMARDALVEEGERGSRDRRPYAITERGRDAFAEWVAGGLPSGTTRLPLLLMMTFGRHVPPQRLVEMLAEQRAEHAARLAGYERQMKAMRDNGANPYQIATLDFGIRYERAARDWFDAIPSLLADHPDR